MAILKKRCPRCKRETKVHAVYSRSDYGNKVMKPIVGQYQCSVCGLCFNLFAKKLDQKVVVLLHDDDEVKELVTMSENEGKVN